jgi:TolB-like protein
MNKPVLPALFLFIAAVLYADPAVAVINFSSGNYCTEQNAAIMTGLFRNELVRSGRAEVVDRGNMEAIIAELKFQMSDWANPARMKRLGQMTGADYIITGNFDMLGNTLYLVAQMTDIETGRIFHSSKMSLAAWEEYNTKVRGFAAEFAGKLPRPNLFTGEWEAYIDNVTYNILFMYSNMCIITVKALREGKEIIEDTNGTWSFDDDIIRINGNFTNSEIPGLGRINWTSVYTFTNNDQSSFNMLISPHGTANPVRVSFARIIKWE